MICENRNSNSKNMKCYFFIIMAMAAIFTTLTSCERNNKVVANYDSIVLAPGESVQVKISGGSARISSSTTQMVHENDSIFSLSDFKRHSVVVTGNNEGKDTLRLFYLRSIYANGEFLIIPISVEK